MLHNAELSLSSRLPCYPSAAMAGKWQNYDYRAVTAGTVIAAIATTVLLSIPARSVHCRRADSVCEVIDAKPLSAKKRPIPLASIDKASRSCIRSGGSAECKWSVRLIAKGDDGQLFEGISDADESKRIVHDLNAFFERKTDAVLVGRPADRSLGWVLLSVALALIVLGIRKNMADKGF